MWATSFINYRKMFGIFGLMILYNLNGYIDASSTTDLKIKFEDSYVPLFPLLGKKMSSETVWQIQSPKGSKISIECIFITKESDKSIIKIDTGKEMIIHNPQFETVFKNISHKNYMRVTFENRDKNALSACKTRCTKSYINTSIKNIDSSEHGQSRTARMQRVDCKCGWANKGRGRIVGGVETGINEFPFVASLKLKANGLNFCGGSIITSKHVLTAAHCLVPVKNVDIAVVVGEHNLMTNNETTATKQIDVLMNIVHEEYHDDNIYNDIGMVVLVQHIAFTVRVGPVCMPKLFQQTLPGTIVKAIGWGLTKDRDQGGTQSNVLRKVNMKIIDSESCTVIYEADPLTHICMYNSHKDICSGDSGGPIVRVDPETNMYVLAGVAVFGNRCGSTNPSVSTNVEQYMSWITKKVEESSPNQICT